MKLSEVKKWFDGVLTDQDISEVISKEIVFYKKALSKKGSSASIEVIEDIEINLGEKELSQINASQLGEIELSYIINGLLLSEKVKIANDEIFSELENYADPEIN